MRITMFLLLAVSLSPAAFSQAANNTAFRYQGQLVELGDTKYEVLAKIGEPDGRIRREREFYRKVDNDLVENQYITVEQWLFNFGPRRFYYILTFEDQHLANIITGDKGYARSDSRNCHPVSFQVKRGDISPVVLMKCGEPSFKDTTYRERYVARNKYEGERLTIKIEEWTYNFGPSQPIGILIFENGELVKCKQGKRGF